MQNFHANHKIMLPLRGVALLFTLIELGLTAYGNSTSSHRLQTKVPALLTQTSTGVSVFNGSYSDGYYNYTFHFGTINFLLFAVRTSVLLLFGRASRC